jgi:hypothetical protein
VLHARASRRTRLRSSASIRSGMLEVHCLQVDDRAVVKRLAGARGGFNGSTQSMSAGSTSGGKCIFAGIHVMRALIFSLRRTGVRGGCCTRDRACGQQSRRPTLQRPSPFRYSSGGRTCLFLGVAVGVGIGVAVGAGVGVEGSSTSPTLLPLGLLLGCSFSESRKGNKLGRPVGPAGPNPSTLWRRAQRQQARAAAKWHRAAFCSTIP